jgi:uncharacterized protein (DUF1778 family)
MKTKSIFIRVSEAEKIAIVEAAKKDGRSISGFIRALFRLWRPK